MKYTKIIGFLLVFIFFNLKSTNLKEENCSDYCFIGLGVSFNIKLKKTDSLYNISEIRINKIIDSSFEFDLDSSIKKLENSNIKFKKIKDENFYSLFCLVDTQNIFLDTLIFIPKDSLVNLKFLTNYKDLKKNECKFIINNLINFVSNKETINEKLFYMGFIFNSVLLRNKINPIVTYTLFMEHCRNK